MMTPSRKLVVILVKYVPVIVLIAVSAWHIVGQVNNLLEHTNRVVEAELFHRWNREVRIGHTHISPLGSATVENIEIAEGRKLAQGKVFSAKRIVVHFNLRALLEGKGAQSVSRVDVFDPWLLLVRHKDGSFNVTELLKPPPGPPKPPFKGIVRVYGASGCFKDYLAHTKRLPAENCTGQFDVFFDARHYPIYSYQIKGLSVKGRLGQAGVIGRYNTRTRAIDLDLDARNASAAYWFKYFGTPRGVSIAKGKLDLLVGINFRHRNGRTEAMYTGTARVAGVQAVVPQLRAPIGDITGTVALAQSRAAISLTGIIAKSSVRVVGVVSDFKRPQVDVIVSSSSLDYAALLKSVKASFDLGSVRISGRGPVKASVQGLLGNPYIRASLRIPRAAVGGYAATNIAASGAYRNGVISVKSVKLSFLGAEVRASGSFDLHGNRFMFVQGNARKLALSPLSRLAGIPISGFADAAFVIGGTLSSPRVAASVQIPRGAVNGLAFQSLSSRLEVAGNTVRIAGLSIKDIAGGVLKASGQAAAGSLDLSFSLEGVDLNRLSRALGEPGYAGTGYFNGRVTGPLSHPTIAGTAEVFKGHYGRYEADYARAEFSWTSPKLTLKKGVVRLFPAELRVAGGLTRLSAGRFSFEGKAQIERFRAENLLVLLGRRLDITGVILGDFEISGQYNAKSAEPLAGTVAMGTLRLEDGTAFGVPVESAVVELGLRENVIHITQASVSSEEAELNAGGSVNPYTKEIDLSFKLDDLDLARVKDRLSNYIVLGGIAHAEGAVKGAWENPSITASGGITKPVVNYKPFDEATFEIAYSNFVLDSMKATMNRGEQVYSVEVAGYNFQTNCLTIARGEVKQSWARDIWDMFRGSPFLSTDDGADLREQIQAFPRITSGIVNGSFQVSGCLDKPDGSLKLSATNVGIDVQQIESIDVDITSKAGFVQLNDFSIVSGDLNIQAAGDPLYYDKKTNVELTVRNFDLSRMRPWLGDNTPGGILDAEVTIKGDILSPETIGSVEVVNPTFRGVTFDRFRASTLEIKDDKIEIADVILAAGSHQAVASGYLPWDWATFSIPSTKPLELTARLSQQDLSMLSIFTSTIDQSKTKGLLEGELRVAGTIAEPQLSGDLKVTGGTVALKGFGSELTGLQVDVTFDGNKVVFNRAEAASSKGGKLGVEPGGYIAVGGVLPKVNLALFAEKFMLAERNFLGLNEDINMQVDAGISVKGDIISPVIADAPVSGIPGGITISNAKLAFALPGEIPAHKPQKYAFNPSFNISLHVGNDVVLAPPSMSLVVTSQRGSLVGSLEEPKLNMVLVIREGTLRMATARLRAIPGGTISVTYAPPTTDIRVDMQATASVMATNRLGQRERYDITLTARGPVSDLHVDLRSQPPGLTRPQMLAALGHVEGLFSSAETGFQQDLTSVLSALGTTTLFGPIENLFVEKFGFEQFSLDYSVQTPLALYVQRRLFGNYYVGYYQVLGAGFASAQPYNWRFTFGYRFRRQWTVSTSVDDQQTVTIQTGWNGVFN